MKFTDLQRRIFAVHDRDPSLSTRAIAFEVGAHHSTVAGALQYLHEWQAFKDRRIREERRFSWTKLTLANLWRIDEGAPRVLALALAWVIDDHADVKADNEEAPPEDEREAQAAELLESIVWGGTPLEPGEIWPELRALIDFAEGKLPDERFGELPLVLRSALIANARSQREAEHDASGEVTVSSKAGS